MYKWINTVLIIFVYTDLTFLQRKEFMKKSLPRRFIFFQIHKILHSPR